MPFVELCGLAKSRLLDASTLGTTRVVGRRGRKGGAGGPGGGPADLADAAETAERGFVSELARSPERVFLPGRKDPVVLRQNSAELFLLARLRDEAHRFAITFHRKLRRERNFRSVLEDIPGIGAGRKKALLRHFGSLKRVKEATLDAIAEVEGFGPKQASAVFEFFHRAGAPAETGEGIEATGDLPDGGGAAEVAGVAATEDEIDAALADDDAKAS
jgi:excinuclease ABC subunit C